MDHLIIAVLGVLAIAAATTIAPRVRLAPPLLLVATGIAVSVLPFVPTIQIEPEWILAGVLPPLLYSAAVSMPTMEFRRDFTAISGLSVILVILSAVALGFFFAWAIPGLGLALGIALGAIISPTDAVATSIVKRLGVSPRIVAMLDGESLLNDATALVLLRAALAAVAASVSFWRIAGSFVFAVVVAVVIGIVVGVLNLKIRFRVQEAPVNTAISFTIPFIAYLPAEHLGASGLVAAVVAGLVSGQGAARYLTPQHRMSDAQNWHTIELLLEGGVFLIMGLELSGLLKAVAADGSGIGTAIWLALGALLVTVAIRAAYVAPLLWALHLNGKRNTRMKTSIEQVQQRLGQPADSDADQNISAQNERWMRRMSRSPEAIERFSLRLRQMLADIDYFTAAPLGLREGMMVIWAGMRGVVTLAAAQTLPEETPARSLLVLVAFFVAAASLLLQGGTLGLLTKALHLGGVGTDATRVEYDRLKGEMIGAAKIFLANTDLLSADDPLRTRFQKQSTSKEQEEENRPGPDIARYRAVSLGMIGVQRDVVLRARDEGNYSAATLTNALNVLDADQISIELKAPANGGGH